MNLSEPFIRRPVMTILVMVSVLFFGIVSYKRLPVSDLPNVDMPTIEVNVSYPGANPETMANAVATVLEQQFMTIESIQTVFSSSNTGSTTIVLQFALDRDIDAASTDVQAAITAAQPNLPSNLPNNPTYKKVNPAATPVLYLAILSENMSAGDLYDYAYTFIGERLSMVDGVAQVLTYGSPYAARIQVDPEKLAAKNIGIDEVTNWIQQANVDLPLGTLWGKRDDYTIDVDGQIFKADGYADLVIKNENGNLVKIKDIGRALDSVENDKFFIRYIDKEKSASCIVLAIQRLPGANTVKVVQGVNSILNQLKPQMPGTLKIHRIYDQSETIEQGVDDVKLTLFTAFLLVIGIIYLFLGRALNTLIPSLALPLSILGTFASMQLLGFSIDILSLLALTLSIGFLVDDAIVVLENAVRHIQMGKTPLAAALEGAREISVTVLSMTLCLAAAFIPLLFMGGVVGRLFREFAATIILSVCISGFISLSLTPMLASRFARAYSPEKKAVMERFAERFNEWLKRLYAPCLAFAMRHRIVMLCMGTISIIGSLLLFKALPTDFLPPDDVGFIEGYTLARDGTSPFLMDTYHKEINAIAIEDPNVESIISFSSFSNPNEGSVFFRLKPFNQRRPMGDVIAQMGEKFRELIGVNVYLSPLPLINLTVGTTAQALYQYSLHSIDPHALYKYAPTLTTQMKLDPRFSQVSSDLRIHQPQWSFRINRDKASNYQVTAQQIEDFFQYAYSDNKISQINGDINQYDVLIETLPRFYRDPTVLSKLYVRSMNHHLVPLSEILDPIETVGPLTVNHVNGLPAVNISFNPAPGLPLGTSLKAISELTRGAMPVQIQGQVIGTADIFKQSFESLTFLVILSFFIIYVILGILYESFIHPLTVMSALPPALFGGLATLFLFKEAISLYSFVGLILLIGIVLKNGIMMIDFAIESRIKEQTSAYDAITKAALTRFRPILMTTVSALMGAVPIALGIGGAMAQSRIGLGLCVVGGLLISQLLTLLLTPVLYSCFETLQERFQRPKNLS